jgi:hypothetical protein
MLVWFALAGRHPFPAGSLESLRKATAGGPNPSLAVCRPGLAPALVTVVEKAIAPPATQRYGNAATFAAALAGIGPAAAGRGRRAARRNAPVVAVLLGAAAVVAFAVNARAPRPAPVAASWTVEANLLRHGDGEPTVLLSGDAVAPGDRLSLRWRATRPTWVYVLNADDRGESYLLFPQPRFARGNPLPADSTLVLPGLMDGRDVAWTVTSAGGRETFLVVAGPEPVPELEAGAGGLSAPEFGREVTYSGVPAGVIERLRGVGGLTAAVPPTTPAGTAGGDGLGRFRALAGREAGITGLWIREIVLLNPR